MDCNKYKREKKNKLLKIVGVAVQKKQTKNMIKYSKVHVTSLPLHMLFVETQLVERHV